MGEGDETPEAVSRDTTQLVSSAPESGPTEPYTSLAELRENTKNIVGQVMSARKNREGRPGYNFLTPVILGNDASELTVLCMLLAANDSNYLNQASSDRHFTVRTRSDALGVPQDFSVEVQPLGDDKIWTRANTVNVGKDGKELSGRRVGQYTVQSNQEGIWLPVSDRYKDEDLGERDAWPRLMRDTIHTVAGNLGYREP